MMDPYQRVKGGRLTFKGGEIAAISTQRNKNRKKEKKKKNKLDPAVSQEFDGVSGFADDSVDDSGRDIYTIDAAKRMKYDELFPVEAVKFGYDPNFKAVSVEDALDDRVKKKADRYCK